MTFLKGFFVFLFICTAFVLCAVNEVEPNNAYNDFGVQTIIDGDHTGTVNPGELDFWKFWSVSGDFVTISCVNNQTNFDSYLYLYDTSGINQLASNDDANGTVQSEIQYQMTTTGYHYFAMAGFGQSSGNYLVSLSGSSPNDPDMPGDLLNPSPYDGALNLDPSNITLSWDFGANTETYDLYIGTVANPNILVLQDEPAGLTASYTPTNLQLDTLYLWRVVAKNSISQYDNEVTWSFRTQTAANIVQVGDDDNMQTTDLPIVSYGYSSFTQTIYTSDELGDPGLVAAIGYQYSGNMGMTNCEDWTIYIGHTTVNGYTSESSWIPVNTLQEVFSGVVSPTTNEGWVTIDLDNAFFYNGVDNLVVSVYEDTPGSGQAQDRFYKSDSNMTKSMVKVSVSEPMLDPFNLGSADYYQTFFPNTRFTINRDIAGAYVLAFPFEHDWGLVDVGTTTQAETVTITNYGETTATINNPPTLLGDFVDQFTLTDSNVYPIALETLDSITLDVCFNPTSGGYKSTELSLSHDWQGSTEIIVPFQGRGLVYDSNNTPSNATELQLVVEDMLCAIEPAGDIDFYSFFQTAPAEISIFTEANDFSGINPEMYLYGPFNSIPNSVTAEDCIMACDDFNGSLHPRIDMNINDSGFYIVRIASYDNFPDSRTSHIGEYLLTVLSDNIQPPGYLEPPTNITAMNQTDCIQLNWELPLNGNPSGYYVFRDGVRLNNDLITTLSYSDYNVNNNVEYEYYLTAFYNSYYAESIPSDTLAVTFIPGGAGYLSDNFEGYENFLLQFGNWITVDGDGENTLGFTNGVDFASEEQPMAFTVFNQLATTPPISFAPAYSGDKALASFAPQNGARNDWLISEEIALSDTSAFVSFYGRTVFPQYGAEQFKAYVITDYTNPDNPIMDCISGNTSIELPADWCYYGFDLDEYLGQNIRIALLLNTESGFMAMLDDFRVTVEGVATETVEAVQSTSIVKNLSSYPNPFNPTTTIKFELNKGSVVSLDIYNIKGQRISSLTQKYHIPGTHNYTWNGIDNSNKAVPSGIYFYKLKAGTYTKTRKIVLIK